MPSNSDAVAILSATRTSIGKYLGALSQYSAPQLGGAAIKSCLQQSGLSANEVDQLIMGCVLTAGLGQAPARQAALNAGLSTNTPCTTINKVCGSGMKSIMDAYDQIIAGSSQVIVAGGMESMSNAPYLIADMRKGKRIGHGCTKDSMFTDGLEDAFESKLMGVYAQEIADRLSISRQEMDDYAIESQKRAIHATQSNGFTSEIYPVGTVCDDEINTEIDLERISRLRPVFKEDGTITAANSSSISDGAAAVCLSTLTAVNQNSLIPIALIRAHTSYACKPGDYPLAPAQAIEQLLSKIDWQTDEVDLYEINEAFAVVPIITMRQLDIDHKRVNIHGGACALGHPLGCSGARIIVTLLHALQQKGLSKGVAAICIGGGEATAIALEALQVKGG
ncbi:thiolase family protein [Neptuniibacter sp.]|uniref:thiolase family protein n=1 Tax=Neptuniibacter sp. TaxID=1962643 RepID=UPI00261C7046|nr:thiolase family protein [Neptuniibacter sp.]MCP4595365.1 thiolase family protein [Neptuniibacter sp.]